MEGGVGQSITLYYMVEGEGQNASEIVLHSMWMIPKGFATPSDEVCLTSVITTKKLIVFGFITYNSRRRYHNMKIISRTPSKKKISKNI